MSATTIGGMGVTLGLNYAGFNAGIVAVGNSVGSLTGKFGGLVKAGLGLAGIVGIGAAIKSAFTGYAAMESSQVAFETLLGSGTKAKILMEDLAKFGAETPFQLPELTAAGKNLAAFGMSADTIVPKLRQIGDISSLLNQPIGEMATLYGKAKVAGVLMSEDINQFTERGVPLIQTLASQFGVAEVSIKKMASEGKISFAHLDQAIGTLTSAGGRFAGGMEKQSQTLGGMWSTLSDNVGMTLTKIGESIVNAFNLKAVLTGMIDFTGRIQNSIGSLRPVFDGLVLAFDAVKAAASAVWDGLSMGAQLVGSLFSSMGATVGGFRDLFVEAMLSVRFTFNNLVDVFSLLAGKLILKLWGLGADFAFIFTSTIPEALKWFANNWRGMWNNIASYMEYKIAQFHDLTAKYLDDTWLGLATIGEKLGITTKGSARVIFDANVAAEKARGILVPPEFKPIPAPVFSQRVPGAAEAGFAANLIALDKRLREAKNKLFAEEMARLNGMKQGTFVTDFLKEVAFGNGKGILKNPISELSKVAKSTGTESSGAIDARSKEAYNVILRNRSGDVNIATRTAKAAEETAVQTKKAAKSLDEVVKELVSSSRLGVVVADFEGG